MCIFIYFYVSISGFFFFFFHFSLNKSFQHFLQGRLCGDELPPHLFFWESLYCFFSPVLQSYPSEGYLCWIKYSWLAGFFFFFPFSTLNISFPSLLARLLLKNLLIAQWWRFLCRLQSEEGVGLVHGMLRVSVAQRRASFRWGFPSDSWVGFLLEYRVENCIPFISEILTCLFPELLLSPVTELLF